MILRKLGTRIREERKRAHLTQEQLAEKVGCNESYIGQVERGEKNPSLEVVVRIANALNVTVDYLLASNVKASKADGLIDELTALVRGRDAEEIRYLININRQYLDLLDRKAKNKR
ncbi:MAG: helix-turn-helix transcriptional regulator [Firmicutes bacterium]|nr:helix-turn-helix transcriptional regulator [Bacillota bacterium]